MDIRRAETLKKGEEVIGARHRVKIVKNKVAPPFKQALFIVTSDGIDKEEAIIDAAVDMGVISKSGAFFKQGDKVLAQGKAQLAQMLKEDPRLQADMLKAISARRDESASTP